MRQGALMDRIGGNDAPTDPGAASANDSALAPVPLQTDGFWDAPNVPSNAYGSVERPSTHAALPKQLGKFPFWRSDVDLINTLESMYEAAAETGMKAFETEGALAESP